MPLHGRALCACAHVRAGGGGAGRGGGPRTDEDGDEDLYNNNNNVLSSLLLYFTVIVLYGLGGGPMRTATETWRRVQQTMTVYDTKKMHVPKLTVPSSSSGGK